MNNTNSITVKDIAKVERDDRRTTTGGYICCVKATLVDGREFRFMANRMSRRDIASTINYRLAF